MVTEWGRAGTHTRLPTRAAPPRRTHRSAVRSNRGSCGGMPMSGRFLARAAATSCGLLAMVLLIASIRQERLPAADDPKPALKEVFGPTKVWAVHLDISAKEFEAMQPAPPAFPG